MRPLLLFALVALTAVAVFSLTGCGDGAATADTASTTAPMTPESDAPKTPEADPSAPQTHSGSLASGDETLQTGEFADSYPVRVRVGQTVVVDATTDGELDPYVILRAPGGEQAENDDFEGSRTHSRVEHVATEAGSYDAMVTSYESGETGSYTVTVTVRD